MNRQKALFEFDGALSYQARAFASLHLLAAAYRSLLDSNEETSKLQHEKKGLVKKLKSSGEHIIIMQSTRQVKRRL